LAASWRPTDEPFEEPLTALAELKQQGLIRHIGLSTVSARQLTEAQVITEIVCVQNFYNVAQRTDDKFVDALAAQGIAYVPYFPLGGFSPLQSSRLNEAAASLDATPMQVALAWLLRRSSNVLLIPGTSSVHASAREPRGCNTSTSRRSSRNPRQRWRRSGLEASHKAGNAPRSVTRFVTIAIYTSTET
jgi:aryl-alcohol dehydrogenase-like predicted oxidoreductase